MDPEPAVAASRVVPGEQVLMLGPRPGLGAVGWRVRAGERLRAGFWKILRLSM
jgi:hypothetical protein